jgi:hypothetical protein
MFWYVEAHSDRTKTTASSDSVFSTFPVRDRARKSSDPQRLAMKGTASVLRGAFLYVSF